MPNNTNPGRAKRLRRDTPANIPGYISRRAGAMPTDNFANMYFVDIEESRVSANRAKGFKSPGWYNYFKYTDQNGNVRQHVEILEAFAISSEISGDGADDAVLADPAGSLSDVYSTLEVYNTLEIYTT